LPVILTLSGYVIGVISDARGRGKYLSYQQTGDGTTNKYGNRYITSNIYTTAHASNCRVVCNDDSIRSFLLLAAFYPSVYPQCILHSAQHQSRQQDFRFQWLIRGFVTAACIVNCLLIRFISC